MKKTVIALTIISSLFSLSIAKEYLSIIKQTESNYKNEEPVLTKETTEWKDTGNVECVDDFTNTDFYYGIEFTQTKDCLTEQSRKVTEYKTFKSGYKELISSIDESQFVETTELAKLYGSHLENNCKEILNKGYSVGDGEYFISFNGGMSVMCDMTRSGGGWTRLSNYDFDEDPNNTPSGLVKQISKTFINYKENEVTVPDAWYTPDITDYTLVDETDNFIYYDYNYTEVEVSTNGMDWEQTMIDIDSNHEISIDSLHMVLGRGLENNPADTTTVNGQYLDGISLTYGDHNNRNHLLSIIKNYDTKYKKPWMDNTDDDLFNDYSVNMTLSGDDAYISGIKPLGSESISARLMTDQHYIDEMIGLTKFKVWIR